MNTGARVQNGDICSGAGEAAEEADVELHALAFGLLRHYPDDSAGGRGLVRVEYRAGGSRTLDSRTADFPGAAAS